MSQVVILWKWNEDRWVAYYSVRVEDGEGSSGGRLGTGLDWDWVVGVSLGRA